MSDPARVFAVLAAIAGVALALALPPSAAPDESRHLSRVYLMSEGRFDVPGRQPPRATVPKSIPMLYRTIEGPDHTRPPRHTPQQIASLAALPLEPERRVGVANAGTYPPLVYLPQLVGVAPGVWLEASPAVLIWLGRLTSLAAWIALTALAIRIAPARRWTLALLSLTPNAVASAAAISADPMTSAAALLFTAVAMRAACGTGALARREVGALLGAALLLGLVKPGYAPLALAALAIPVARCGGRARQFGLAAASLAAVLVPSLGWLAFAQRSDPAPPIPGADPFAQLAHVLGDLPGFAAVLGRTLWQGGPSYWTTFVGKLGPLAVELPALCYAAFAVALVAVFALDGPRPAAPTRAGRAWLGLAAAGSALAVFAFAYLGWNAVGAPAIAGVQGRYLAPALPLLAFAIPPRRAPLPRVARDAALAVVAASFVATLVAIGRVYYR